MSDSPQKSSRVLRSKTIKYRSREGFDKSSEELHTKVFDPLEVNTQVKICGGKHKGKSGTFRGISRNDEAIIEINSGRPIFLVYHINVSTRA